VWTSHIFRVNEERVKVDDLCHSGLGLLEWTLVEKMVVRLLIVELESRLVLFIHGSFSRCPLLVDM